MKVGGIGTTPEHGLRLELTRGETMEEGVAYDGVVRLSQHTLQVSAVARAAGVKLTVEPNAELECGAIEKVCSALLRAATRSALEAGIEPPRAVVRWRPFVASN